jgi:hypothetical protein
MMFSSSIPKTNSIILLDMGPTLKKRPWMGRMAKGKKTKNLNVVDVLTI